VGCVFQSLKASFIIALLLIHVDPSRPSILEMDAFDFALNAIFSQIGKHKFFPLFGFYSHNFLPIKINYKIHDKELLAIMDAFEEWHH
jgi:hypothetical protein